MDSLRHSPRTVSPVNATSHQPNVASIITPFASRRRQSVMSGTPVLPASNSPISATSEESRNSGRPTGMRGGMSQFRAQPVYSKQKLRVKQYDPTKKSYIARSDDETEKQEGFTNVEINGQNEHMERVQQRASGQQITGLNAVDDVRDAIQHLNGTISPTSPRISSESQIAEVFTPERLAGVISYSITKCREKRMTTLGLAIKRLWQESHEDSRLSHILGSVLSQTATEEEKAELQDRVTINKKRAKAEITEHKAKITTSNSATTSNSSATPSQMDSPPREDIESEVKSPPRRTRASARKSKSESLPVEEGESKKQTPSTNGKRSRTQISTAEESTAKRQKRSDSVSSSSSLSSAPSDVDQDADLSDAQKATRSSSKKMIALQIGKQDSKSKGPPKKVPGSLEAPRINGKIINTLDEPSSIMRKQKKQEFTKVFDHVKVNGSHIRTSLRPVAPILGSDNASANISVSSTGSRGKKKDFDDLESIASSAQDDLLIPPPPEARRSSRSRQATPNAQRFRTSSARVQARIKIS